MNHLSDIRKPGLGFRRYWRHWWPWSWWFTYVVSEKCICCDRRWRDHKKECWLA